MPAGALGASTVGRTSSELAEARIGTGDHDAVLCVWSGDSSSSVLTDECRCSAASCVQLSFPVTLGHMA